MEVVYLTTLQC